MAFVVEWKQDLLDGLPFMSQYRSTINVSALDWIYPFWEQSTEVRIGVEYRLRPRPQLQGGTWFDRFVDSLVQKPERLAAADSWAERFARSTFLYELLVSGAVDGDGRIRLNDIDRDNAKIALSLGLHGVST